MSDLEPPFSDFIFCDLCKRNFSGGNRHYYSKLHKEKLHKILSRQIEKYSKLKQFLNPVTELEDASKQPSFWCVFCDHDVRLTAQDFLEDVQIACKHVYAHLASEKHRFKVEEYLEKHYGDISDVEKYTLDYNSYQKFKRLAKAKVEEVVKNRRAAQAEAETLFAMKQQQNYVSQTDPFQIPPPVSRPSKSHFAPSHAPTTSKNRITTKEIQSVVSTSNSSTNPKLDEAAKVLNLTRIQVPSLKPGQGNVHDSATVPPWLLNDSDSDDQKEIGPSEELFRKAQKIEQKKKLNPKRLGANLDRQTQVNDAWVPNFGRVWNAGSRSSTRIEFWKERGSHVGSQDVETKDRGERAEKRRKLE
ncbi:coiled-coil domain-containing protein 84 protein [Paraphysoderma sedebokerense]|nr:coiled-coil domain-containing protein 84 protein [Paraphysoderma sedebokerense]